MFTEYLIENVYEFSVTASVSTESASNVSSSTSAFDHTDFSRSTHGFSTSDVGSGSAASASSSSDHMHTESTEYASSGDVTGDEAETESTDWLVTKRTSDTLGTGFTSELPVSATTEGDSTRSTQGLSTSDAGSGLAASTSASSDHQHTGFTDDSLSMDVTPDSPVSMRTTGGTLGTGFTSELPVSETTDGYCMDDDHNCPYWASNGECGNNPGYMLYYCRLSCGVCYYGEFNC